MASHENSRKKRKVAHMDGHTALSATPPPIASSSALPLPPPITMNNNAANAPCHHEQALKALNTDLDAMRQLVTCKICDRLLYEPYALSCGHTYCYSCLSQWLGGNAKMTCPDCRAVIRQQPTPSYLLRELVLIFISRNELLPDGETVDEHNKTVREEAELVTKDRENQDPRKGGLFKGRFNKLTRLLGPVRDVADGVDRCPECHWELEEGHCIQCGYDDDNDDSFSLSESGLSDEEVDMELRDMDVVDGIAGADGEDDWSYEAPYPQEDPLRTGPRRWHQHGHGAHRGSPIDLQASSDDESEEDEYDQNDTFIDDGTILEEEEEASGDDSDVTAGRNPAPGRGRRNLHGRPAPVVISDDEAEDGEVEAVRQAPAFRNGLAPRRRRTPIGLTDDEEDGNETVPSTTHGADESSSDSSSDSEDEGPVIRGSQRNKRPAVAVRSRRAVTVSSSEDESEDTDQDGDGDGRSEATAPGGFSPIDDGFGDQASVNTDFDDYGGSDVVGGFAAPAFNPYEPDEASDGSYDDESDDGWGLGTTTNRNVGQPHPAPSARLGTLQQRRPRHASPQHRSAPVLSPSTIRQPMRAPYHPIRDTRIQPNNLPGLVPISNRGMLPPLSVPNPGAHPHHQPAHTHPFQLGNVLNRINTEQQRSTAPPPRNASFNQRNQHARTYTYQRNVPAPVNPTGAQASSSTSNRATLGSTVDARRKRGLSVESDDSQQYYV